MNKDTQLAVLDGKALTERDMFHAIDKVIDDISLTGNIQTATKALNALNGLDVATGHVKSKLLWHMNEWYKLNKPQDDFGNYIESNSATKKVTVTRYVNVWQQIEDETIPKKIQARPMRDLIPIASMLTQGYEPTKEQWSEIDLADNDLRDVLNKIKNKKPRKSGLKIVLETDGFINVYRDNKKTYLGFLDLEEAQTNPDLEKAIERIVQGAYIIRK